jgi:hypothetical protein
MNAFDEDRDRIVLSLFDRTGNMVKPWLDAGYRAIIVDIQHPDGERTNGLLTRVGGNVLDYLPPLARYAAVFAFPPCTDLAVSGAAWFAGKGLGKLSDAIRLFWKAARICEWSGAPYLIENPVSTISTYWRKPDFTFDPCDYALWADYPEDNAYTKKTCLWTGGGFVMPPVRGVQPTHPPGRSPLHMLPPSPKRADLRSQTPVGFARAVFDTNHPDRSADRPTTAATT